MDSPIKWPSWFSLTRHWLSLVGVALVTTAVISWQSFFHSESEDMSTTLMLGVNYLSGTFCKGSLRIVHSAVGGAGGIRTHEWRFCSSVGKRK